MSAENSKLLKGLGWGANFTVALNDEWDVIEHPELPGVPYMPKHHTPELLERNPVFCNYLQYLEETYLMDVFVDIPAHVTLETFHEHVDSLT